MWALHIIGRILFCRLRIYEFYDFITLPLEVGIKCTKHRHAPEYARNAHIHVSVYRPTRCRNGNSQ